MLLYRPVGLLELRLMHASALKAFPPRLPEQPIFYPVLNREYARQIASEWNTKSAPFAGYVTEFEVQDAYLARFEAHIVGGRQHEELWVPAEELAEFNRHLLSQIRVVEAHFGKDFQGLPAENTALKGKTAIEQFVWLAAAFEQKPLEAAAELKANSAAVFLHFPFWPSTTSAPGASLPVCAKRRSPRSKNPGPCPSPIFTWGSHKQKRSAQTRRLSGKYLK